jgi:hypothetical protein
MKIVILLLTLITPLSLLAQTIVSGTVLDERGEPVPGANVFLLNTYDGATTNASGKFEFKTTETGNQVLVIKFIGYKEFRKEVILNGSSISIQASLKEEISELKAVTITAGAFAASDESRRTIFRAVDIATTAGATADIAGALNTLPGTQKVGESGRLFVRGGDGYEARTFIDGMVVLDAYSPAAPNTPSRGRFLPFMFKGTSFSTGGYSAEYGQALSSALVLDSKDNSEITRTDFGLLSVGGDVAHTQAWKNGSVAGKIQYTNLRPYIGLISQEIDWRTPPSSLEGSTAFRQRVGKDGMIKFYGNFNQSSLSLYNHDILDESITQLYDLTNSYRYANGFYKQSLNDKWSIRGGVSYSHTKNDIRIDADDIVQTDKGIHVKSVLEGSISDKLELRTGVEVYSIEHNQQVSPELGSSFTQGFDEVLAATFVEADIFTSNNFVTRAGTRVEYNSLQEKASIDPRLSLAYKVGEGQVSLAYGTFRQTSKSEYVRVNTSLESEKAEHYILNYQLVTNRRTFRVETYFKQYNDLVKFENGNPTELTNAGSGFAKGFELFWRDNQSIRNVDYWISYSYLDTERNYLNTPYTVTPSFASAHNFSAVYKHFVSKLKAQFGVTYSVSSGRPYNNPNQTKFNNGKTPAYQDLSANISYLPKPQLIVYVSCTNLLGHNNIFGYEFSQSANTDGVYESRAIRQPAPRFLFIGIFLTLSKDKSSTQLPTL